MRNSKDHFWHSRPLCFMLLMAFCATTFGQTNFRNFNLDEGLPSSMTYESLQDSRGHLWIGTSQGVARFDGKVFKNFTTMEHLSDNEVINIEEDSKGRIWFFTLNGSPCYFWNDSVYHAGNNAQLAQIEFSSYIKGFWEDADGTVWLGSHKWEIARLSPDGSAKMERIDAKGEVDLLRFIARDKEGQLLIGGTGIAGKGMRIYNYDTQTWSLLQFDAVNDNITGYTFLPAGRMAIHNGNGVFLCDNDGENGEFHLIEGYDIAKIYFLRYDSISKNLFAGTDVGAFTLSLDNDALKVARWTLRGKAVTSVLRDNENDFWFTTLSDGIFMEPVDAPKVLNRSSGLAKDVVVKVVADKVGNIWLGHHGPFVTCIKGDSVRQIPIPEPRIHLCYDLLADEKGVVWVATNIGLYKIENGKGSNRLSGFSSPKFIAVLDENHLLLKDSLVYDIQNDSIYGKGRSNYMYSAWVKNGKIELIGSEKGVLQHKSDSTIHLFPDHPISKVRINAIYSDAPGKYWIASNGEGIVRYENGHLKSFTTQNGLSGNFCNAIAEDETGAIWIGSNGGLDRIVLSETGNKAIQITHFGTLHGLPSAHVNGIAISNGNLFVGTQKGLATFDIHQQHVGIVNPPAYLDAVGAGGKILAIQATYQLPINRQDLEIVFHGVSLRNGQALRYKYKMEGLEEDWKITSNRSVSYPYLPAGTYTFRLGVMPLDGDVMGKMIDFQVVVPLVFYRNPSYQILFVLFLFAIVVVVFRLRLKAHQKRDALQRRFSELKHQALQSQMNPHFTFNCLSAIQNLVTQDEKEKATVYISHFSMLIRLALQYSRLELVSFKQELDFLNHYIALEKLRQTPNLIVAVDFDVAMAPENISIIPFIIQPFVENAIRHGINESNAAPKISLRFYAENEMIICEIRDNGKGYSPNSKSKKNAGAHESLGLKLVQEKLDLFNSTSGEAPAGFSIAAIQNASETGTIAKIWFPVYF